jgi:hypothetical protein
MKYCTGCGETKPLSEYHKRCGGTQGRCKPCFKAQVRFSQMKHPTAYLYRQARDRAKRKGVLFTLKPEEVVIPEKCPCCKVEMLIGAMADRESSPSLDQIIPGGGYTPENTIVICFSCNRLKSNVSPERLYQVADYVYVQRKVGGFCG